VLAFEILNLHDSRLRPLGRPPPVMVSKVRFIANANTILTLICPAQWAVGSDYHRRAVRAVDRVLSALLTIARVHRNEAPAWNNLALIQVQSADFAANVNWGTIAPPLPAAAHRAAKAALVGGGHRQNNTTILATDAPTIRDARLVQAVEIAACAADPNFIIGPTVGPNPPGLAIRTLAVRNNKHSYFRAIS
jgi:hypothetical protein